MLSLLRKRSYSFVLEDDDLIREYKTFREKKVCFFKGFEFGKTSDKRQTHG